MIVDQGRVAYVTIAQGRFLGLGETLKPSLRYQALDWQAPETFGSVCPRASSTRCRT